jgi:hypothetical protein
VAIKLRVKPIIQMTDDELKDEFEQYELRNVETTGDQNV